jgi:hypothetical protein
MSTLTAEGRNVALRQLLDDLQRSPQAFLASNDETYLLGTVLAHYLGYLGSDILAVTETALSTSGLYRQAQLIKDMREAVERGDPI